MLPAAATRMYKILHRAPQSDNNRPANLDAQRTHPGFILSPVNSIQRSLEGESAASVADSLSSDVRRLCP